MHDIIVTLCTPKLQYAFTSFTEKCSPHQDPDANYNILLSGASGRFDSPLFPLDYHINMKCRWIITVPSGHRIKISFQTFYLGSKRPGNCDKVDHVEVRDSFTENDPGYGIFCGNDAPPPIYSVGPKILVTFISDEERFGFAARFAAISDGKVSYFILTTFGDKMMTKTRPFAFGPFVNRCLSQSRSNNPVFKRAVATRTSPHSNSKSCDCTSRSSSETFQKIDHNMRLPLFRKRAKHWTKNKSECVIWVISS